MNLFDLVQRRDRCVEVEGDPVVAEPYPVAAGHQRSVRLPAGSLVRIVDAHEHTALWLLADDIGWSIPAERGSDALPEIRIVAKGRRSGAAAVVVQAVPGGVDVLRLRLRWPLEVVDADAFDLEIGNPGGLPVRLMCGPLVNMREYLLPHARGRGVEVGPGLRPHVRPGDGIDVEYVEEQDPREWLDLYNKTGDKPELPEKDILDRYRRGSAVTLAEFPPHGLDFVFSNHVFEHLPNPFQVLANWRGALRPGGMIIGVLPDPRFTFDCRQPPTTVHEALAEETAGGHDVRPEKYERWCRWTEPLHTPADLVRRGYSIHVNYFTPESFRSAIRVLEDRGWFDRVFVYTAPNHKDFAFALRCAA